jgi:hypothetical protein
MKPLSAIAVLLFVSFSVCAQAATSCDDLKAEIAKKVEANGVKSYTLDIVDKDKDVAPESKVVGTCEGGTTKNSRYHEADAVQRPLRDTSCPSWLKVFSKRNRNLTKPPPKATPAIDCDSK